MKTISNCEKKQNEETVKMSKCKIEKMIQRAEVRSDLTKGKRKLIEEMKKILLDLKKENKRRRLD